MEKIFGYLKSNNVSVVTSAADYSVVGTASSKALRNDPDAHARHADYSALYIFIFFIFC